MAERTDILWGLYLEHRNMVRHHATQRATISNLIVLISTGILGLIKIDNNINSSDLPLAFFLLIIGLYGALMTAKHGERFNLHKKQAETTLKTLDLLLENRNMIFTEIEKISQKEHEESGLYSFGYDNKKRQLSFFQMEVNATEFTSFNQFKETFDRTDKQLLISYALNMLYYLSKYHISRMKNLRLSISFLVRIQVKQY